MDVLKIIIFGIGCLILGILGAIAARSIFAGIILAVFVFVGWILWRLYKYQGTKEDKDD